jgi:hypothetical protein
MQKRKGMLRRLKNPAFGEKIGDPTIADFVAQIAGDELVRHATRSMSGAEKILLSSLIEIVIRPLLGRVSKRSNPEPIEEAIEEEAPHTIQAAIECLESERIEGEYEECR